MALVFRPRVFPLEGRWTFERLFDALWRRPGFAALDSAGGAPRRHSLLAFDPLPAELAPPPARPLELRAALERLRRGGGEPVPGPFHGGFLGGFAYDLGVAGEELALPDDPWRMARSSGALYVDFVVLEHGSGRAALVLGEAPGDGRPALGERRERALAELAAPDPAPAPAVEGPPERAVPPALHRARIERLRGHIAAGELYQANLAHRFACRARGEPAGLYRRLRAVNPAPYMAFLPVAAQGERAGGAILSSSPELLLEHDGEHLRTRPIKGTIARAPDAAQDERQRARLRASAKDLAELAMIVDLERNDLARVAATGSVEVEALARVESYARVHHLVADLRARLAPGRDAVDALAALFPGGSVTGAPKLRAMEAIAELEGEGRGWFTGCAGFLDLRGHAAFDILIRTLVWRWDDERARAARVGFHVGGGITWRSDPEREERETLDKAAALFEALGLDGTATPCSRAGG